MANDVVGREPANRGRHQIAMSLLARRAVMQNAGGRG